MTIANPINFVNSYTNTAALNGLNAMGTLLEPYDGIGYTLMMGGNPAQMDIGIGIYTTAKFGRVLRYVGTMGQSIVQYETGSFGTIWESGESQ